MARAILLASGGFLPGFSTACLFVPAMITSGLGLPESAAAAVPLAAPAVLGIGALNVSGRGAIYGGIYGRPIVLANFMTAGIATFVFVALQLDESPSLLGGVLTAAFTLYWLAFARLLFWPPFDGGERGPT